MPVVGLRDRKHRGTGNGSIDRVAAVPKHRHCRQRLGRTRGDSGDAEQPAGGSAGPPRTPIGCFLSDTKEIRGPLFGHAIVASHDIRAVQSRESVAPFHSLGPSLAKEHFS